MLNQLQKQDDPTNATQLCVGALLKILLEKIKADEAERGADGRSNKVV